MTGLAKTLLYSAAAGIVTISAILQSPSAQNVAGPAEAVQVSKSGNAPTEMPTSLNAAAAAARAKADALMGTGPASLPSPSQNSAGEGNPTPSMTYGPSEMPNSVTAASAAAQAKASAAMVIDPNAAPVPFPVGSPDSQTHQTQPK